jgi:hypothetical protein
MWFYFPFDRHGMLVVSGGLHLRAACMYRLYYKSCFPHNRTFYSFPLNPDCAVGIVARRRKPLRNAQLERFWPAGIFINMSRARIVKSRFGGTAWIFKPQ